MNGLRDRDSGNSSVPLPAERGNKQNKPAPKESRTLAAIAAQRHAESSSRLGREDD